ncbi:hypothetical protein GGD41_002113 [Paraburkholderia bryophila]|uniref:Uncharacterized protein n=1 Tax=Paraburkholderia bryophila TaxID=420952 RepID=A0A7Z0AZU2_9BURK|nr:hypothetical protein [Paraburkholderia bryophila]
MKPTLSQPRRPHADFLRRARYLFHRAENLPRFATQIMAGLGQHQRTPGSVHQLCSEPFFE